jgi:hypothetical protein
MAGGPPRIDSKPAQAELIQFDAVMAYGENREKKEFLRNMVTKIELAPEELDVKATFNVPGQLVYSTAVATEGANPQRPGYEPDELPAAVPRDTGKSLPDELSFRESSQS